jgi:hypothetical protein
MRSLLNLAILAACARPSASLRACTSASDCSYNGACDAGTGVCSVPFTGLDRTTSFNLAVAADCAPRTPDAVPGITGACMPFNQEGQRVAYAHVPDAPFPTASASASAVPLPSASPQPGPGPKSGANVGALVAAIIGVIVVGGGGFAAWRYGAALRSMCGGFRRVPTGSPSVDSLRAHPIFGGAVAPEAGGVDYAALN